MQSEFRANCGGAIYDILIFFFRSETDMTQNLDWPGRTSFRIGLWFMWPSAQQFRLLLVILYMCKNIDLESTVYCSRQGANCIEQTGWVDSRELSWYRSEDQISPKWHCAGSVLLLSTGVPRDWDLVYWTFHFPSFQKCESSRLNPLALRIHSTRTPFLLVTWIKPGALE